MALLAESISGENVSAWAFAKNIRHRMAGIFFTAPTMKRGKGLWKQ
jgi:hypothetical protein